VKAKVKRVKVKRYLTIDYEHLEKSISKAIIHSNSVEANQFSGTREWMKFILIPMFWIIVVISGLAAIGFLYHGGKIIVDVISKNIVGQGNFLSAITTFMLGLFSITICVFSAVAAREIDKENDRQYIASMFSNIVALVALIVALAAFFKGVG